MKTVNWENGTAILDCTLRDGGRIIDCQFSDAQIYNISNALNEAHIDIIELGFLDNTKSFKNSTYFKDIRDTQKYLKNNSRTLYTVFANFGRFDFQTLPPAEENLPAGIRIGFTGEDFGTNREEIAQTFKYVKSLGYTVFLQALNSLAYSEEAYGELIRFANDLKPYSFAIVDTYGSMFEEDLEKYYNLAEQNLLPEINLDFHSHNNLQLSFALAIWLLSQHSKRNIIIDATLYGMGRGGGNLNIELIAQYLNQKFHSDYDLHKLIDLIDLDILPVKQKTGWGYSLPAFLGGISRIHPKNINKFYQEFKNKGR